MLEVRRDWFGFGLFIVLFGCGNDAAKPASTPNPDPKEGSGVVTPDAGGTVTTGDGQATVEVPPGAVSEATTITIKAAGQYPDDPRVVPDTVYDFGPDGIMFAEPVVITLEYQETKIREGIDEEDLRVQKVGGDAWLQVPGGMLDAQGNAAMAPVNGFSTYGVRSIVAPDLGQGGNGGDDGSGGEGATFTGGTGAQGGRGGGTGGSGATGGGDGSGATGAQSSGGTGATGASGATGGGAGNDGSGGGGAAPNGGTGGTGGSGANSGAGAFSYVLDDRFALPGFASDVTTAAIDANGTLYAMTEEGIAVFDGATVTVLPETESSSIYALATHGTDLYAAGNFASLGGTSANSIARWDGMSWSALGSGVRRQYAGGNTFEGSVYDVEVSGDLIYVAGEFNRAGPTSVSSVAVWDTTTQSWADVAGGVQAFNDEPGTVESIALDGADLYVTGNFSLAQNSAVALSVANVARFNGTFWEDLPDANEDVVGVFGRQVIVVGGNPYVVGGPYVSFREDGDWSAVDVETFVPYVALSSIAYLGGEFFLGSDAPTLEPNLVRWDGDAVMPTLTPVDRGLLELRPGYSPGIGSGRVAQLLPDGNDLYVVGALHVALAPPGPDTVLHSGGVLLLQDGETWQTLCHPKSLGIGAPLTNSLDGMPAEGPASIEALAAIGTDVYATGAFLSAGCGSQSRIARWDGAGWRSVGSGLNAAGRALAVLEGDLYAGGEFTSAGGVPANYVARWNGSAWSALGAGANDIVTALASAGSTLYLGGDFTNVGGTLASRVAAWNGASFMALGAGLNGRVSSLAASGQVLYAGGGFTGSGATNLASVARWNGVVWSAVGSGFDGPVGSLALVGSSLFASGGFTSSGATDLPGLAVWDGSAWRAPAGDDVPTCTESSCRLGAGSSYVFILSSEGAWIWDGVAAPERLSTFSSAEELPRRSGAILELGSDLFLGGDLYPELGRDYPAIGHSRNFQRLVRE